ncbi:MAG: hypothetical protein R3Y57_06735 [Erysipelotrichaceae bacterium]
MNKRILVLCSVLFLMCGCTTLSNTEQSIIGEWESTDEWTGATIISTYYEDGSFTLEYLEDDNVFSHMEAKYQVYFGSDAYDKLTEENNSLRWQETLVDTLIDAKEDFTIDNLVAIELSNIEVYYDGELDDNENDNTESLNLSFMMNDGNELYASNTGGSTTIYDDDFFRIFVRK